MSSPRWPTRSIVLDHGEVIAHGKPDEVRRNEEVLRAYLGRNAQASLAAWGRRMLLDGRVSVPPVTVSDRCCSNSRTSTPTTATCTS